MLKTVSIVKNGLFVDYSVLPTPIQLKRENKFEQEMKMFPVDGKRQSIGRRTGKEMPDIYGGSPFAPKKALWKADKIKNQYILLGEIIHAWRPVLYGMIMKCFFGNSCSTLFDAFWTKILDSMVDFFWFRSFE